MGCVFGGSDPVISLGVVQMFASQQNATVAFLCDPASHGSAGPVETMETHISRIFLVDDRAFKLKRDVKLPYVDFSTPELRRAACEKEVALNSPSAPGLYIGVRDITRQPDGALTFDGSGEKVDSVVEMVRFDQDDLFDHMADHGKLTPRLMHELTEMVVKFHNQVEVVEDQSGAANIAGVLDINEAGFQTSTVFTQSEQDAFNTLFRKQLAGHAALLNRRAKQGKIRLCHGDLHLRNICLFQGKPRLFDCIEFNDQIATVDVLYDLAFLLMDLWHLGLRNHANLIANRYVDMTGEDEGYALLAFFMALRAAVRAHVTATQAQETGENKELAALARIYFDLARELLEPSTAQLIAIGGFSGSGKTTIADNLAPYVGTAPGARIVESDRIRKAMFGVPPETRLDEDAYLPEVSEEVYARMCQHSALVLNGGASVIANAVFDIAGRRTDIGDTARQTHTGFTGIWLDVPTDILRARVAARKGGQSDATLNILDMQLTRSAEDIDWQHVDGSAPIEEIVGRIRERLLI